MKIINKLTVALLIVLLLPILCYAPKASGDFTDTQKAYAFLTDVIQLDLSQYQPQIKHVGTMNMNGIGLSDEVYGSLINDTIFPEGGSSANLDFIVWLKDGVPYYLSISGSQSNNMRYSQKQPDNALDMSKEFLNRYKEYLISYCNVDTAYLNPMIDMLSQVTQLSPTNATSGDIQMKIASGIPPQLQPISKIPSTTVNFDYTENGIDVSRKYVSLDYENNSLSHFQDSWNLYNIGTWNMISKEEAVNIAYASAQNLMLKFGNSNGSITEIKPDLTNSTYTATLSMTPRPGVNGLLYPSWYVEIDFQKSIYSDYGIGVQIWADTKEVTYCQSLCVLGTPPTDNSNQPQPTTSLQPATASPSSETNSTPTPTGQTTETPVQASTQPVENSTVITGTIYLIEIFVGLIIITGALLAVGLQIKRRNNNKSRNIH
jgi:hypothetical protein